MDIIGIGRPCIDILTVVESLPKPNSGSGIIDFSRQGGGNVATAMAAAARLGAKAGFIGLSGSCAHGKALREDFEYNGVDISHSVTVEGEPSDFAIILSDLETRGRSIMYKGGGIRGIELGDLEREYITGASFLHLEGCGEPERTAAAWMRAAGKKVSFDVSRHYRQIDEFTPCIDVFVASEFYYKAVFGESRDYEKNSRLVAGRGPEIVVFTLGEKGCAGYCRDDGFFYEEAYKVEVFDTLGAGDVYHGAFLAGLAKGFGAKKSAKFANAVSAVKICHIGGRAGIPNFETAEKFMETGIIDDAEIKSRVRHYRNKWLYG
ncbi:MAG: carbohydrate kinase family protein [Oscillospiraceae bacterium]|nr:carbohydrate kinase family protein [Oscillospiraceae bacterium]